MLHLPPENRLKVVVEGEYSTPAGGIIRPPGVPAVSWEKRLSEGAYGKVPIRLDGG
jgi:hypothetical protein